MNMLLVKNRMGFIIDRIKFSLVDDHKFNCSLYKKAKGRQPDLQNPTDFSEKLLYLKEHYRNPLQTICSDKYFVKNYIELCGLGYINKKIYGVYKSVDDIPWDDMPDRFFIHCNHMSGCNFVFDKSYGKEKKRYICNMLKMALSHNWYYSNREWNYKNIDPLVVCEELLCDQNGRMPVDYKFYCFSGKPMYYMVSFGEYEHKARNHKFDMNNNSIDHKFKRKETVSPDEVVLPSNFEEMVAIVEKLCEPFPHVRVDLYNIDGRIVFGELTFYSNSGVVNVYSKEFDKEIGSWISLEKYAEDMV